MTDNIPPEIADEGSAPAPVRVSPEVRETLMIALRVAFHESQIGASETDDAIAYVEALP